MNYNIIGTITGVSQNPHLLTINKILFDRQYLYYLACTERQKYQLLLSAIYYHKCDATETIMRMVDPSINNNGAIRLAYRLKYDDIIAMLAKDKRVDAKVLKTDCDSNIVIVISHDEYHGIYVYPKSWISKPKYP